MLGILYNFIERSQLESSQEIVKATKIDLSSPYIHSEARCLFC